MVVVGLSCLQRQVVGAIRVIRSSSRDLAHRILPRPRPLPLLPAHTEVVRDVGGDGDGDAAIVFVR